MITITLRRVVASVGLGLGVIVTGPCPTALAQQAKAQTSPEAGALMEKARAAIAKLQSVAYTATATTEGVKAPSYSAEVYAKRVDAGGWAIASKGSIAPALDGKGTPGGSDVVDPKTTPNAGPFEVAYDGVTARSVREKDKSVAELSSSEPSELHLFFTAQNAAPTIAWEVFDEKPLSAEGAVATIDGKGTVGDVECQILKVAYNAEGARVTTRYFIDADGLPRRIERVRGGEAGGGVKHTQVLVLGDLKPDVGLSSSFFVVQTPDGYTVKSARPPAPKRVAQERPRREQPEDNGLLAKGSAAPDWTLKDGSGKAIKLSGLRGRVVVLDFWATWCGPCKAAMPSVQKIHEKYQGKAVSVFGVNCWERGDPEKYMKSENFTYGLLLKGDDVAKAYQVQGIPTFYVIGPTGEILWTGVGFNPGELGEITAVIDKALANAGL